MNKKIKFFIVWILLSHAVFAFGFFLVIPLLKAVYVGEEFFWFQYPLWRMIAIIAYLGMIILSALLYYVHSLLNFESRRY
jgi:sterol desaturase/sphingolipid hydroxylase (fatty acid hydroxylase superfamily)